MNNRTFVCFTCRTARRLDDVCRYVNVTCASCDAKLHAVNRAPKRNDDAEWKRLSEACIARDRAIEAINHRVAEIRARGLLS